MTLKSLIITLLILLYSPMVIYGQNGVIKGRVYNSTNNEPIPFANILVDTLGTGTTSDIDGNFRLDNLSPGSYNVVCSYIGYKRVILYEVRVTPVRPTILDIGLEQSYESLGEITVRAALLQRKEESPVSRRSISATEIYRSPGGNRDISKVIQVLPGVASSVSYRNDIIVRGGAPNENRFYLDGIEVPNINHFATQGSSGGPVGMINVNFLRGADFYAGAFPANRGNALSSVMELHQINGNDEKLTGTFMIGSSDMGITLNGPSGKNSSFILSARRSYLQFLFKALKLPFLPTYNDFQYKHTFRIDQKNQLILLGLGAIDDFSLNKDVNDGLKDQERIDRNNYILGNLPVNTQWNYTVGAKWTHFSPNSQQILVVSRNHLNNSALKYRNNIEEASSLLLDYNSQEIETKLRFESTKRQNGWKWNVGGGYEHVLYTNSTFNKRERSGVVEEINFDSRLHLNKYSLFTQLSRVLMADRLTLSLGIRTDFNDYSNSMYNPLDQLSPRFSASYLLLDKLSLNMNLGRYYQLPAYTVMGYGDGKGGFVNKGNNITYIQSDHLVGGLEYNPTEYSRISVEAFYKRYSKYPFLVVDGISLANLGSDYGVIGNEEVTSTSKGRSYGIELLMQQTLTDKIYGIISYTWVRSGFQDARGSMLPSAWDNGHILNITAGIKLKRNWEMGMKFRLLGGAPYTPYDEMLSAQRVVWDVSNQGILDWDRLNKERNSVSHGLDIRVDKRWYFKRWNLDLYMDIQNVYNSQIKGQPYLDVMRNEDGTPVIDPLDESRYMTRKIDNTSGNILPSVGIMIEF